MSAESSEIGVGVVGLGYWGPNHLRVLEDSERARPTWICDRDPARLDRFRNRTGASTTADIGDLLDDPGTDAIVIATPISTHYELGRAAIEAGKHVLIEKPVARSTAEAEDLIRLAESKGVALMCGHTFLHSPPVAAIKGMLDRGELGEIYFISSSRVNLGLHQRDVSVLWDLAPHDFSIFLHWLDGTPDSVSAVGRDSIVSGTPDVAFLNLRYATGLIVNVELSWLAPSKLRRTAIVGSEKMVVYDDTATEQVRVFDHGVVYDDPETFGEFQLSYRTGDILSPRLDTREPLTIQLDVFLDSVAKGAAPPGHGELARNVVGLTRAAEESLRNGGRRIELGESRPSGRVAGSPG